MARKWRALGAVTKRLQKRNTLQRFGPLVRSGAAQEPWWMKEMLAVPPFTFPPYDGNFRKQIVYPTDRLVRKHEKRNPQVLKEPMWLGAGGAPTLSYQFASRQYELMQKGVAEEEAYSRVETEMAQEWEAKLAETQELIQGAKESVGGEGNLPVFLSDEKIYTRLLEWRSMLDETPYYEWELGAKASLDHWLVHQVMGWSVAETKAMRSLDDGTLDRLEEEVSNLRVALFPETMESLSSSSLDRLTSSRELDEEWAAAYQTWQDRIEEVPDLEDWDILELESLFSWIENECIDEGIAEQWVQENKGRLPEGTDYRGLMLTAAQKELFGDAGGDSDVGSPWGEDTLQGIGAQRASYEADGDILREQEKVLMRAATRDRRFKEAQARIDWEHKRMVESGEQSSSLSMFDRIVAQEGISSGQKS